MTTSLTDGKLVSLPLDGCEQYLFRETDWKGKIPDDVLSWMTNNSPKISLDHSGQLVEYHELPEASRLPVIFAVRMSLSFPVLFTTTKLYRKRPNDTPQEVIFTDGGVTSNFPIHFFDSVWPQRPTFGITLRRTDSVEDKAFSPKFLKDVSETGPPRHLDKVGDFISALLSTMQEWTDNQQANLKSAQQRIVEIPLSQKEGGLNLTMSIDRIECLVKRGEEAGRVFNDFDLPEHRWTRYVSSIVSFAKANTSMTTVWDSETPDGDMKLSQFLRLYPGSAEESELAEDSEWQKRAFSFAEKYVLIDDAEELIDREGHHVQVRIVSDDTNQKG